MPSTTLITNVRVFDGQTLTAPQDVLISDATIADPSSLSSSSPDSTVDGTGLTLLPGLIDAHVHISEHEELRTLATHGITTTLDMAAWPAERINALRNQRGLTDIRTAGAPASTPNSTHTCLLHLPECSQLTGADKAEAFVEDRIREGSDYIKLIADVPGPSQELLDALVAASEKRGLLTVVHAAMSVPYAMAQKSGARVITHAPLDAPLSSSDAEQMKNAGRVAVPTLTAMVAVSSIKRPPMPLPGTGPSSGGPPRSAPQMPAVPPRKPDYANARESVRALHAAGVPILAGTDAVAQKANAPFFVPHGSSLHEELVLLRDAGLSNLEALQAATILPAQWFGLEDRGRVEVGMRADLVLVRGDPIQDIKVTRNVEAVWCSGVRVDLKQKA